MKTRYAYDIYAPSNDPNDDPYTFKITVYSLEEAKRLCPLDSFNFVSIYKQMGEKGRDEYGEYVNWDTIKQMSFDPNELVGLTVANLDANLDNI